MIDIGREIRFFHRQIPEFACIPGCHDCCGPVMASSEEMARLPVKSKKEHAQALNDWSCPHLGDSGCQVYADRPLICRLFGTIDSLRCPHGRHPDQMTGRALEARIFRYMRQARQVLV